MTNLNELKQRIKSDIFYHVPYAPMPTMSLDGSSTVYQNNLEHFIPEITAFKKALEAQIQYAATDYQNLIQNKEDHFQIYTNKVAELEALEKQQEELKMKCHMRNTDIDNLRRQIRDNLIQAREFAMEADKIQLKLACTATLYIFAPNRFKKETEAMYGYRDAANKLFDSPRLIEQEITKYYREISKTEEDINALVKQGTEIQELIYAEFSDIETFHLKISDQLHHLGYLENLTACIQNHSIGSKSDQELLELLKQDPEEHHYAPSKMSELIDVWNKHHDDQYFHDYITNLANL